MSITISFGLQKGGVGKTTVTAITAFLLSQNKKVLAVDFDSQGNLTQMLTQKDIYEFTSKTVLEAVVDQSATDYIYQVSDLLHLLPAEDLLAYLPNKLIERFPNRSDQVQALKNTLDPIKDNYDFILIDLPPNVGDQTLNGLIASDFGVVVMQSEPFAFNALERYLETMELAQEEANSNLRLAGILTSLMSVQVSIDKAINEQVREDFEQLVFNTVIRRKTRIKEFSIEGINNKTRADREALEPYESFLKELLERVEGQ